MSTMDDRRRTTDYRRSIQLVRPVLQVAAAVAIFALAFGGAGRSPRAESESEGFAVAFAYYLRKPFVLFARDPETMGMLFDLATGSRPPRPTNGGYCSADHETCGIPRQGPASDLAFKSLAHRPATYR